MPEPSPAEPRRAQADVLKEAEGPGEILPRIRARLIGGGNVSKGIGAGATDGSNQLDVDENRDALFINKGALEPPYDPEMLCLLFEHSAGLRPNIDSYATNIDGFGHRLEPFFNIESDEGRRRLATAARAKKSSKPRPGSDNLAEEGAPNVSDDEIREALGELADEMLEERRKLDRFFENCCLERSFVKTRRLTRQDMEIMGNAYWEVLRNRAKDVTQFVYLPGFTVRLMPIDPPIEVEVNQRVDDLKFEKVRRMKRFRRFVQIVDSTVVFFKEFGDPRVISAKSGAPYKSVDEMRAEEGEDVREATELIHFQVESAMSAYGVPRWVGALLAVMGSRQSEEVNFLYFENKSVPPLAVLVSGGRLSDESVTRIEDHVNTNIKGKHNFHKILVLEAEPAAGGQINETSTRMRIQIQPLTGAQQNDALFQKYDERNMDKIGGSFRLPRLLRGDIRDFNRSTAMAALNFAEMQVFQPEREDFDWIINNIVLRDMGVRFWRFVSRSPVTRDPVAMAEIIRNLTNANVLVPEEGRELAEDVFNREFRKLDAQWAKQPMQMTLAGMIASPAVSPSGVDRNGGTNGNDDDDNDESRPDDMAMTRKRYKARRLIYLREELEKAEEEAWTEMLRARNL